ncbi:MAG: T9SS type A sorting domain-containing protein [Chlorobi bacterium]|nr:T9SS type A sorting domain-containing protein [Chlorobiota bacterium]
MKKILFAAVLLAIYTLPIIGQTSVSQVTEIDYFNALRYVGGRNIARTTDGYAIVIYEPGSAYTNQEIWYAYFNTSFGTWDISQLSKSTTGSTGTPAIVADDKGMIYASWKEKLDNGNRGLMYSNLSFTDEFTYTWTTPVRADTFTNNNPGVNTINLDSNGDPFIMFSIWGDGTKYDANIYVAKNIDGTWSTDNLTAEFPTPNVLPFMWMDVNLATGKDGQMFAAWEDKPTEIVNQSEVLLSKYTPSSGWTRPEIVTPIFDGVGVDKYDDGYTPIDGAVSIYEMGPADYELAGYTTVLYNETATSKSIVSSFNPYYVYPEDDQQQYLKDVINFFGVTTADSILLVDDDNRYNNEDVIQTAIEALGIPYRTFDCGDNGGMATDIPSYTNDLAGKKLVIWFTGDEYKDLAFWSINDTVNTDLKTYLDDAGSQLFVVGKSWMYDKYGNAPDTLHAGDFAYDYLGISIYDVQSWTDDGNKGVPQLDNVDNTLGVSSVAKIGWKNSGTRQGVPSIATDPSYNLHMVYKDDSDGSIKYMKYDGSTWSEAIRIDASADTMYVDRPNISIDPNYGVYVIWREETSKVDGKSIYNVFYRTSPDGGVTWNDPVQLSNSSYVNADGYSTYRATIGIKVRDEIPGKFNGGADVVWVEASEASSLGYYIMYGNIPYVGILTDVKNETEIPMKFELGQNYPNPFNPSTTFTFSIPEREFVTLSIYNSLGQKVGEIVNKDIQAGTYNVKWNAGNFTSGVYFARLTAGKNVQVRKVMLLK